MLKPAGRVFDCADQMSLPPDTFDPLRVDPAVVFGEQARDRPDVVRQAGTRECGHISKDLVEVGIVEDRAAAGFDRARTDCVDRDACLPTPWSG